MYNVEQIREAIIRAMPETSSSGQPPKLSELYIPPAHIKALRPESNLVVGARGVGKSFWTAALSSSDTKIALDRSVTELSKSHVRIGFSQRPDLKSYPDGDIFSYLVGLGYEPYVIWRAVICRWFADLLNERIPVGDWSETTKWIKDNPEHVARLAEAASAHFSQKNQYGLIVFDALDRTSSNWETMDKILNGLLRVILWLKSFPNLHGKVFLREDQLERKITDFPDASKILSTRVDLTWEIHDLHGLLWQTLCNAPDTYGECLRHVYKQTTGSAPRQRGDGWEIAGSEQRDGSTQRTLFAALAGPWMGNDRRRGVPYVWSVSHLADGRGRTSPRSFIAAIKAAAEDSGERYIDYNFALHYESIKRGVQEASQIRVNEMAEDYPWVTLVMQPLNGLTVPCEFNAVSQRWDGPFQDLFQSLKQSLPPLHWEHGQQGLRQDLERLGIFETMKDGRVNLPDLYRVGFKLGRRGGVRPVK